MLSRICVPPRRAINRGWCRPWTRHGGGVGFSQHAGMVIVCDGTEAAARRLARVLWNDPATGIMRHADASYDDAIACAKEHGLRLPGILG